jgi:cyanophycinase
MLPLVVAGVLCGYTPEPHPGHLVIVGGGQVPVEVFQKALTLSGGKEAHVLVIPQASLLPTYQAQHALALFRAAGARRVAVLDPHDRHTALGAVRDADLIWISGGDQTRLMRALTDLDLTGAIRERFRQGATVCGTSAGAAVMSQVMLMGVRSPNRVPTAREVSGLGLWPDVIVDQHFLRRHRTPRLLGAVLHHPDKPGVGIDEATAVVVEGHHFEVIGNSEVMVLDARHAPPGGARPNGPAAAPVSTYLLAAGMEFDLDTDVVSREPGSPAAAGGTAVPLVANATLKAQ